MVAVPKQFREILSKNPDTKVSAYNHGDSLTTFVVAKAKEAKLFRGYTNHSDNNTSAKVGYICVSMDIDGADPDAVFKTIEASTRASMFYASAEISGILGGNNGFLIYTKADAKLNLLKLKGSVFNAEVSLSAQTDLGFKDYSIRGHILGAGFTFGKRISISSPFGSFRIDIGQFFS
ncbi:uncharacterized protein LY79DRAFT_595498 [Colletotrichum navitas]|uniref:Uncharacterized protein n=1 Tax=Colletotrichum navitas TaxID=681940 RepID=A0AAD8PID1_9PEZI|nr:uncharacterized protein LY79DRAFT_595498 [Colletotrichum navitas]KAK1561502.1 hypothetical protein LY79DRAFT_595498 [Colletotrichum navitas]